MKIFKKKKDLQKVTGNKNKLSFIPTMGGFHKGHISLIRRAKKFNNKTLVSIFINPKQFNKKSDFLSYPRNLKKDIKILKRLKVNYLYIPSFKDIYDFKPKKKIFLDSFSKKLCGKYRKGHFKGVINVINRFLEIIKPKYIFLGKKDYQQLYLIKRHINKRKIKSKIIECKTIREKNGVACSTRNFRLSKKQFIIASNIYKYIFKFKKKIKKNYNFFLEKKATKEIIDLGANKIDYIENYNIDNFKKAKTSKDNFNTFVAYHIDKIRLIDNL